MGDPRCPKHYNASRCSLKGSQSSACRCSLNNYRFNDLTKNFLTTFELTIRGRKEGVKRRSIRSLRGRTHSDDLFEMRNATSPSDLPVELSCEQLLYGSCVRACEARDVHHRTEFKS